jgi:hypothetical protein
MERLADSLKKLPEIIKGVDNATSDFDDE